MYKFIIFLLTTYKQIYSQYAKIFLFCYRNYSSPILKLYTLSASANTAPAVVAKPATSSAYSILLISHKVFLVIASAFSADSACQLNPLCETFISSLLYKNLLHAVYKTPFRLQSIIQHHRHHLPARFSHHPPNI